MDARTLSIRTIFGQERRHVVPLFQRPYVWTLKEQWAPLWDDVRGLAERLERGEATLSHFLGAIVLEQVRKPTGQVETRLVVDGQQRLTTIQLMVEAFADFCAARGLDKVHKSLVKLTRNDDPMSEDPDEEFKIWPTNLDQTHFRRVMAAGSPEELRTAYDVPPSFITDQPIANAYLFFSDAIQEWVDAGDLDARVAALLATIRDHLRMVVIDLDREDDPQLIFETLNARGTPLLPSDLVKNFVFHRAQLEQQDIGELYEQYWKPFDEDSNYWRREIGRGHARRAKIDLFLQHYLTLQTGDEVPLGHLYNAFRAHAADGKAGSAEQIVKSMQCYAAIYRSFDEMPVGTRQRLFFERLESMDVGTAHPFLLALFSKHSGRPKLVVDVLVDVESFLVRRLVCQLNTRGYNRLFLDALKKLTNAKDPHQEIREYLLSSSADFGRWPDDAEFKKAWLDVPAYRVLVRQRVRMILEALERQLHTGKTEQIGYLEKLTIEHLLPQEWKAHWPLDEEDGSVEEATANRDHLLNTFGNLTLLTKKLNPSVSNGPWAKKRPEILKYSALALNRDLNDCPTWGEAALQERGAALFNTARKVWPRP